MKAVFDCYAQQIKEVVVGDKPMTLPEFVAICRFNAKVILSPAYEQRVRASREALEQRLKERTPIYGINTGFGGNVDQPVADEHLVHLQENIIFSHAVAAGQALSREQVRSMLLMLINVHGQGYSAVRFEFAALVRDFLNHGITPYVPAEGTVGGLSYITYASMTLLGKGRVIEDDGRIVPAIGVLQRHGLEPLILQPREGLGITSCMSPHMSFALLALYDLIITTRHADLCCALCFEALRSTDNAMRKELIELKGQPEVTATADWLRRVLAGSENLSKARAGKVQDGTSIRIIPYMMGAFKSLLAQAYEIMMREMHSVSDNPIFLKDGTALMGAGWDSSYEAIYCDALCVGVVNVVKMINTHEKRLVDSRVSGLYPYLIKNPGVNNGFMMVQNAIEGFSAEIAQLSNPMTAFYTTVGAGQEGPNPLSDGAGLKLCQVAGKFKYLVSMTTLSALQALDLIEERKSPVIDALHAEARKTVTFMEQDDVMYERTEAMLRLTESCALLHTAEEAVGPFTL